MRATDRILFWIAVSITICGAIMISPVFFSTRSMEIVSRSMIAIGCVLLAVIAVLKKNKASVAYSGFGKKAIVDNENGIRFEDVAANMTAKSSLIEIVDYLKFPEKYASYGARMPKGIILYGPPGTGKTMLAKALAGEAGVPFFAISGSDFVQMYVGVGAGRIRELFANARKGGKGVIFIDEIDALGKRRNDSVSEERDQTLNALLSEMSGFNSSDGVIVVAATNRIEALDAALLRPGRFDRQIEVGLPGRNERYEILCIHSKNKPLSEDVDLRKLARETGSFSGASLESLLNEAAIAAASRCSEKICKNDIDTAFVKTVAGADGAIAATADERCTIALHEAGHAIALKALIPTTNLKRISILSAARGTAGYNMAIPEERSLLSKGDIESQIIVLLAGRAAEMLIGGNNAVTTGAAGDLARAAELAGSMIMDLGMGEEPGVALRAIGSVCGGIRSTENDCRMLINRLYEKTNEILAANIDLLMQLTEELLEKESLEEKDIEEFFIKHELYKEKN